MACSVHVHTTRTLHHIALFLFGSYGTAELRFFFSLSGSECSECNECSVV